MDVAEQDGQQYDPTEQRRFETDAALKAAYTVGDRMALMQRLLNKHREVSRLDERICEFCKERDRAKAEFDQLVEQCREAERLCPFPKQMVLS